MKVVYHSNTFVVVSHIISQTKETWVVSVNNMITVKLARSPASKENNSPLLSERTGAGPRVIAKSS